jgi:Animal haem peroxidase
MRTRHSRRWFLGALGVGAGALVTGAQSVGGQRTVAAAPLVPEDDQFGRMFPDLPPALLPSPQTEATLMELGKPGGLLDAKDDLGKGPVLLITEPALSANNPNNPNHTAGTTFMGQFMDHDMSFDTSSRLGKPTPPQVTENHRTPAFDLDSVYGGGPTTNPQLYDATGLKFRVGYGGQFEDLPRAMDFGGSDPTAVIADPRNDENLIIAGLHAAALKFHNNAADYVKQQGGGGDVFAKARQLTTWHYQWLILNEFLPLFVGPAMVKQILDDGRRFYTPSKDPFIPVEFQGAAYRFGHSLVRPSYRANLKGDKSNTPFFGLIFDPAAIEKNPSDPADLSGGARAPRRFVGWQTFFDFGDGEVKPNKRIDTKLSTPLFSLPPGAIAGSPTPAALPQRTLLRHVTWKLPSGQKVAEHMGLSTSALKETELQELRPLNLDRNTPLFYYILKEAQLREDGLRLGPVGGRIVGEVILGLLQTDPTSYLSVSPAWTPTLQRPGSAFRMTDFLKFAQVDPVTRGQ